MNAEQQIDIVILWVDGNNPEWRARYLQYKTSEDGGDKRIIRFRDWGLLPFWFRGVEKFAPWVRKIHFVTSGELPDCLEVNHPKLNWVKHEDFIPQEYLPTFSANTIELNLHRIEGLSDRFIYFNDDMFLIREAKPTDFFKNGLPYDYGVMSAKPSSGGIAHMVINNLDVLEKRFDKHTTMKKNFFKWFSLRYGSKILNNILLYPWREFSGFVDPHVAQPFCKNIFKEVWEFAPDVLDSTCRRRFRTDADVNHWLLRYWQLAAGAFYPQNKGENSICMDITNDSLEQIKDVITSQKYLNICLNDSQIGESFENAKQVVIESFSQILAEPSSFEKQS